MINWNEFLKLPGSSTHNFEMLCRSLIRLNYGKSGKFGALANQPGVEFHLRLDENCALGAKGRWFGWQCRFYDIPKGVVLGKTRKDKIKEAITKTIKVLPDLTDWVLWTLHPLTKADQEWFDGLKASMSLKMKLDAWSSVEVEGLLIGDAEILRRTYFGELLLTPALLTQQHAQSISRIKMRWLPEAHQQVDAERQIRRMLGESSAWSELITIADRLKAATRLIEKEPRASAGRLSATTLLFLKATTEVVEALIETSQLLIKGDLQLLYQRLSTRPKEISRETFLAPVHLRSARLSCGLDAVNALIDLKLGLQLLDEVERLLGIRVVGILADAGGGKTQLAAEVTASLEGRPAGILLHGHDLQSGKTIDDLAKSISIQGNPVPSIEALLAALDAAGQRSARRIPLVFDGLNEAEDPRAWKAPLAALDQMLLRFPNVLVVATLRTGARRHMERDWAFRAPPEENPAIRTFAKDALPDDIEQIEMQGFGEDMSKAIRKYFRYFKILPGEADLPYELLQHPLTLRLFCEVTNPKREKEVGIEAMPGSLTGIFERYLERAGDRIGELAPLKRRYFPQDVRSVLHVIGQKLWDTHDREISEHDLRVTIGDEGRPWNESIVHLLEQEGVILRTPGDVPGQQNIIAVYDALGGYLIANSILTKLGRSGFEPWLKEPATSTLLNGHIQNCHPLAADIFRSLAGLLPRKLNGQQLWQLLDSPLRESALRLSASLEGTFLDATTVTAVADVLLQAQPYSEGLFGNLYRTRGATNHPLNADFLDSVLKQMSVSERDLHWSEWVRNNRKWIETDLVQLEAHWQKTLNQRTAGDKLRSKWVRWLLTTTIHNLRDRATRALYWFGRGDASSLFKQVEETADVNDPYVFERVLAASYGVAMAHHCDPNKIDFRKTILPEQARSIFDILFSKKGRGRTTHVLIREYALRFIELAVLHNQNLFSAEESTLFTPPYPSGGQIAWNTVKSNVADIPGESPFRMDFENYTLGHLTEGRPNYDYHHKGYRKIRSQVLWRVQQQLGWSAAKFQGIDRNIESERHEYGRSSEEHHKVDRYGKKYSMIAYLELQGWLKDKGLLKESFDYGRTSSVDIDPSFPNAAPEQALIVENLLGKSSTSLTKWINEGPTIDFKAYLRQPTILGVSSSWIALDGFVTREDKSSGRRLFAFIRSFLVPANEAPKLIASLNKQPLGGRWLVEKPTTHYVFAGEMPWCSTFPKTKSEELKFLIKEEKIMVKRKQPVFLLDGKFTDITQIDLVRLKMFGADPDDSETKQMLLQKDVLKRLTASSRFVEVEETKQEFRKIRTIIPVVDFGWDGRNIDRASTSGVTLTKEIAKSLNLSNLPQTIDLQTKEGIRATGFIQSGRAYGNQERFCFIREDLLRAYLKKKGLAMVWAVWGERERITEEFKRPAPENEPWRMDFKFIHRF